MRKIVATSFSVISFGLLVLAAIYDNEPIAPMYGAFAYGLGWCAGGFWVMVVTKEDK